MHASAHIDKRLGYGGFKDQKLGKWNLNQDKSAAARVRLLGISAQLCIHRQLLSPEHPNAHNHSREHHGRAVFSSSQLTLPEAPFLFWCHFPKVWVPCGQKEFLTHPAFCACWDFSVIREGEKCEVWSPPSKTLSSPLWNHQQQ